MKALAILVLALAISGTVAATGPATPSFVSDSELTVGGIFVGQKEASVLRLLGPPQRRKHEPYNFLPVEFHYPGIVVFLGEGSVGGLLSTSSRFCTPSKVCPGSKWARARKIYGPPLVAERNYGTFMEYPGDGTCWLQLAVKRGTVKSVGVACQP